MKECLYKQMMMHIADGYPADKLGVGGGGGVFFIG